MGVFEDSEEVHTYLGGVFRVAADHPRTGARMRRTGINLRMLYTDPDTELWVLMREPEITTVLGTFKEKADVTVLMRADHADRYWRGQYSLLAGLLRRQVKVRGSVSMMVTLMRLARPLFPVYRDLIAGKDMG